MIYVIGIIILLLVICFFVLFFKYVKLKDYQKSLDMCSISIDDLLTKKLELVNSLISDLNNEKIKNDFNYDKTGSIYEREDALFNVGFEINKYIKDSHFDNKRKKKNKKDEEIHFSDEIMNKVRSLNKLEEDVDGLKDYYNANVLNYNEVYLKKNFNKFFKLLRFPVYKSFKIRKLEEYEIFKN